MRTAVSLALAFFAAQTLRPVVAHCQHNEHLQLDQNLPNINVFAGFQQQFNILKTHEEIVAQYVDYLEVACSKHMTRGQASGKLIFTKDGDQISTNEEDSIVWSTRDPAIGKTEFVCADIESGCQRSVNITITPVLEVSSPSLQFSDVFHNNTVQYGGSVLVVCDGPASARLSISKDGSPLLTEHQTTQSKSVMHASVTSDKQIDTTLKWTDQLPDLQISKFVCTDLNTGINSSLLMKVVPFVHIQSRNQTIKPVDFDSATHSPIYWVPYGESIEIFCFGPRVVELISYGYIEKITTESVNNTAAFKMMNKINSEVSVSTVFARLSNRKDRVIICRDKEIPDYMNTISIKVKPLIEVMSPNMRLIGSRDGISKYGVKIGEPLEIICSGVDASQLVIRTNSGRTDIEIALNETTVKYAGARSYIDEDTKYVCYRSRHFTGYTHAVASVEVVMLPEDITDFHCISLNVQYLNCTWTVASYLDEYTLSFVDNGNQIRICEKPPSLRKTNFCVWDYEYENKKSDIIDLSLLLETCNNAGCMEQTFHIDHSSIVKPAPPIDLVVSFKTSRSVGLRWSTNYIYFRDHELRPEYGDFNFKVQYWYSGIERRREVNASLVTCEYGYCEIKLSLPCPGQFYEVWIYHKLNRTAGKGFWSEPRSVTFYTDPDSGSSNKAEPTCYQGPIKTKEVMRYFVQKLIEEMRREMAPMKNKVVSLQKKLAEIRTYK